MYRRVSMCSLVGDSMLNVVQFVASIGKSIVRSLGFPPGSAASSYTQLYAAFTISALAHTAGDAMLSTRMEYVGRSCPYFIAQAVAITFEDAVIGLARKAGYRKSLFTRAIGYVWVIFWFTFSIRLFLGWMFSAKYQAAEELSMSPTRMALMALNSIYAIDITARFPSIKP